MKYQILNNKARKRTNKTVNVSNFKGSITVEAAFLMPLVIITIFALMYLSFYLHDRCVIQGKINQVLHKAGITVKHDADIASGEVNYEAISDRGVFYLLFDDTKKDEKKVQEYLKQELARGLFLSRVTEVVVSIDKFRVLCSVEGELQISLPGFRYIRERISTIKIQGEYPVHNPTEAIRGFEVVLDTGSRIKGVDKLKDAIEGFINKIKK